MAKNIEHSIDLPTDLPTQSTDLLTRSTDLQTQHPHSTDLQTRTNDLPNEPPKNYIVLNEAQNRACTRLNKFLDSTKNNEFILLGPAGSGKTTVIVNVFNNKPINVAFCAFTNKATQVLKKIADKFQLNFVADFMTIHTLLRLEQKYLDNEREITFSFDKNKIAYLQKYQILIFDECSTISNDLYTYIRQTQEYLSFINHPIKIIFLGDFWQLPPVGEDKSVIFEMCKLENWKISKLEKVLRCSTTSMQQINEIMLDYIVRFKNAEVDDFTNKYPYNLVPKNIGTYLPMTKFLDEFLNTWQTKTPDTIILTYSKKNCENTNHEIQDRIDAINNRDIPQSRNSIIFHVGDRCCIDRPITLFSIERKKKKISVNPLTGEIKSNGVAGASGVAGSAIYEKDTVSLKEPLDVTLYNGEIFDIIKVENVSIVTALNKFTYMPKTFDGQILTISRINDASVIYDILHIPAPTINAARILIKKHERRIFYLNTMSDFINKYPHLNYGYCITIYKSQGSEWDTVFVNLNSIKWSIIGKGYAAEYKKKVQLFKSTYTAISRASKKIICLWTH